MTQLINAGDVKNLASGTLVVSSAQKFVLPIPQAEGEDLIYPKGWKDKDAQDVGGRPIANWKGEPKFPARTKGFLFLNHKDHSLQGARTDGTAIVIINQVSREQARQLYAFVRTMAEDPNQLDLGQLKQVLDFAKGLGLDDQYDSDRTFDASKFTLVCPDEAPRNAQGSPIAAFGWKKRDDRDICQAVFIPGQVEFAAEATATPQIFKNGAVLVKQGSSVRGVQPDIFCETYRHAAGAELKSVDELTVGQL